MKALKLKIIPTSEQYPILDEMFKKWASLCTRMSFKNIEIEKLHPPGNATGIWFSKSQLHQAKTDISDLQNALKELGSQKKRELERIQFRRTELKEMLDDPTKRDALPNKPSNFRPKTWVVKGLLKTRYHLVKHWEKEIEKLCRIIEKKEKTLKKITKGRIRIKPKKISLHQNAFRMNFRKHLLIINPFGSPGMLPLTLNILFEPIQPLVGKNRGLSSARGKRYLQNGILNYISFSLHSLLFGMGYTAKMLRAKNPEKVAKRDEKIKRKQAKFPQNKKSIEKLIGRNLAKDEETILDNEFQIFFDNLLTNASKPTVEYARLLSVLSTEIFNRDEILKLNKYPILVRKPINKYKCKNIKNLKPREWEYFLQLGYEQLLIPKFSSESIMGIDRGLTHLLAVSIFDPRTKKFVVNQLVPNPIKGWKWKVRKLKRALQHLERRVRAQTGTHLPENSMKKKIKSIENRIENLYHNVSRDIINLALHYKSTIVFEDLERRDMKQHGRKKSKWTKSLDYALSLFDYAKLAFLINHKASTDGIPVYKIGAAETSQNCALCLLEGKDANANYTRDSFNKKIASCKVHYKQIDADLNAARTIAVSYHLELNNPRPFNSRG